jgi:hypothetical protein
MVKYYTNLYDRVMAIYPELTNGDFMARYIVLRNDSDGNGDYIFKWEHPTLAEPTEQQLNEAQGQ